MVQAALADHIDTPIYEQLDDAVDALFDAYEAMPLIDDLADASVEEVVSIRDDSIIAVGDGLAVVSVIATLAATVDGEYGQAFQQVTASLAGEFTTYRDHWRQADLTDSAGISVAARQLQMVAPAVEAEGIHEKPAFFQP